jgi:hypothetical protein
MRIASIRTHDDEKLIFESTEKTLLSKFRRVEGFGSHCPASYNAWTHGKNGKDWALEVSKVGRRWMAAK